MTLGEKIKLISTTKCNKEGCSFLNQKLSDAEIDLLQNETYKFAIEFGIFIQDNCDSDNCNNTYWYYDKQEKKEINLTVKELLEIFKKEKYE
jgi:hypothetical protein